MKLGIDCRDLLPESLNGIGRYVRNLLCSFSLEENPPELFLYGNQRTVFTIPDAWGRPIDAKTRRAPEAATWWWDRVRLPRLVHRDRLDVFLSPFYKAPGIRSCPVAITVHDLLFLRMPPELSGRSAIYSRAFRLFAAGSARRAAVVLTVSEYSRQDIVELLDVPREKTRVVGNCVGPAFQPVADPAPLAAARHACGIDKDYVLYVGNFGPHKNIDGLLAAFAALPAATRSRLSLVLAGRPDRWLPRVREAVRRLGLADSVRTPGHITETHLPALYAGAAAFVTLSRWEGFGLPVVEAMACGAPVLCSARASLPEISGGAALLVDPDDITACAAGLDRVLSDRSFRAGLREKGLARARDFAPHKFASLVLDALRETMAAERAPAGGNLDIPDGDA